MKNFIGIKNLDILFREAKIYNYSIPTSLDEKVVDFYLLIRYINTDIRDEELRISYGEAINKLVYSLKEELLNKLYYAITGEIGIFLTTIFTNYRGEFSNIKNTIKSKIKSNSSYGDIRAISNTYFNEGNREDIIDKANRFFIKNAGSIGKPYSLACEAWILLNKSSSLNDIGIAIDHIIDLEHNNGTIFERFPGINTQELRSLTNFIYFKGSENMSEWDIWERASFSLKPMMAAIIKSKTGIGYDIYSNQFTENLTKEDRKRAILYIENLLNKLSILSFQIAERVSSEKVIEDIDIYIQAILDNLDRITFKKDILTIEDSIYNKIEFLEKL